MEIKTILVPVDFTPCANNAVRHAVQLAKVAKAKLLLLHTYDIPATYGEVMASSVLGELAQGVEAGINQNFEDLLKAVPSLHEVAYETKIKLSPLANTVENLRESEGVGLVVVGTRGAQGVKEFIVGTNTYAIVKEAECPVLVVPEIHEDYNFKKIALASDYKKLEPEVLAPVRWIAMAFGAELHILHVSEENDLTPEEAEQAKKFEPVFKDIKHHYHLIVSDDVEKGLESYNEQHQLDMLALVPRKHSMMERLFGSSESKKLIFHTKIPLLALPTV